MSGKRIRQVWQTEDKMVFDTEAQAEDHLAHKDIVTRLVGLLRKSLPHEGDLQDWALREMAQRILGDEKDDFLFLTSLNHKMRRKLNPDLYNNKCPYCGGEYSEEE